MTSNNPPPPADLLERGRKLFECAYGPATDEQISHHLVGTQRLQIGNSPDRLVLTCVRVIGNYRVCAILEDTDGAIHTTATTVGQWGTMDPPSGIGPATAYRWARESQNIWRDSVRCAYRRAADFVASGRQEEALREGEAIAILDDVDADAISYRVAQLLLGDDFCGTKKSSLDHCAKLALDHKSRGLPAMVNPEWGAERIHAYRMAYYQS